MFLILLLQLTLLLGVNANFKIKFSDDREGTYKLVENVNGDNANLQGGQAFVLFATVVSPPVKAMFRKGDPVALKIGWPGNENDMENEAAAHKYIMEKTNDKGIDGIVKIEAGLGTSHDLKNVSEFKQRQHVLQGSSYSIIVMEPLGKDIFSYHQHQKNLPQDFLLAMLCRLNAILKALADIQFSHGDVNLKNILLSKRNNVTDPITLIDLGFAVFKGSNDFGCAGHLAFMSSAQMLTQRNATYKDCVVSGVYCILYLYAGSLPWMPLYQDFCLEASMRKTNLHDVRIAVSKYGFERLWFGYLEALANNLDYTLRNALQKTLTEATSGDKDSANITDAAARYTAAIVAISTS